MLAEHIRHIHRQRTIHKDRNIRNRLLIDQLMQQQHHLLRPPHRKRRHHNVPAAPRRPLHQARQLLLHRPDRLMQPIAIRALHDQIIRSRSRLRIIDDRQPLPPHIAREQQPRRLPLLASLNQHASRPQHVPRIKRRRSKPRIRRRTRQQLRRMHRHRLELLHRLLRILLRVERLTPPAVRRNANRSPPVRPPVHKLRIRLLNMRAVLQHLPA